MHISVFLSNSLIFFSFSSRRRHTRWPRVWSSDVCSSDLRFQCHAATFMLLTLLLSFAVQGCYKEEFPGNPTVALVVKTLNNPFFNDMQDGAEEMARKLELNLIVQAAEREIDVEQQVQIVENLIQRRVDAI